MPDEFIPGDILLRIIVIENNNFEHKGYIENLAKSHKENDLYYAIRFTGINESGIMSGYIYTNVNISRQNSYVKLIFTIYNLSNENTAEDHNAESKLIINYNLYSDGKPLNYLDNPEFFPIAFPTLFSYRDGGHIAPQSSKNFLHA